MSLIDLGSAIDQSVHLRLRTVEIRDHSAPAATGIPTIVVAPFVGHATTIADHDAGHSLMAVLRAAGVGPLYLTSWRSATPDMADLGIENYLEDLLVCLDDLGGRANLVGLGLGGWMCALLAARFPERVNALVLAGTPVDGEAVDGPMGRLVVRTPLSTHQSLVRAGRGVLPGEFLFDAWPGLDPAEVGLAPQPDLWDDLAEAERRRQGRDFATWDDETPDLPGRLYLEAIEDHSLRSEFAHGGFPVLGRPADPKAITCPLYLLAGDADAFVPPEQVFAAARLFGTPKDAVRRELVAAGHVGLFMGCTSLAQTWPRVGAWLADLS